MTPSERRAAAALLGAPGEGRGCGGEKAGRVDLRGKVRKQALVGHRNRRVAALLAVVRERAAVEAAAAVSLHGEFFCTCGRPDCDEILVLTLDGYRYVQEAPYRFVVAPGHATEADEVVLRTDEYDVVEIVEPCRCFLPEALAGAGSTGGRQEIA